MTRKPRYRLAVDVPLARNTRIHLKDNVAHYLTHVLRLNAGDAVVVFSRAEGEWRAEISDIRKREVALMVGERTRAPEPPLGLTVCFAPIKGGRLETIIEKATELGASVLQPVITARTIVDKVNAERAEAIAREAAEQCERIDWPEIRLPVKLPALLGNWPAGMPLIYGDESGESVNVASLFDEGGLAPPSRSALTPAASGSAEPTRSRFQWGVLVGPEGGFTSEEFALLRRVKAATGVSLGPRILRADTAVITLCVATLQRWGDWDARPRFKAQGE